MRKEKFWQLKEWEVAWLRRKADEANRVLTGCYPRVSHCKDLVAAVGQPVGDGSRRMAGSQAEVESWKDHFEAIQAGIGDVNPSVC